MNEFLQKGERYIETDDNPQVYKQWSKKKKIILRFEETVISLKTGQQQYEFKDLESYQGEGYYYVPADTPEKQLRQWFTRL